MIWWESASVEAQTTRTKDVTDSSLDSMQIDEI
jgi:hypothetical protein